MSPFPVNSAFFIMALKFPLPPGYSLYRFPSVKRFHDFVQETGHGSNCQYTHRGVIAAIYDELDTLPRGTSTKPASYARYHGAKRLREQPRLTPSVETLDSLIW